MVMIWRPNPVEFSPFKDWHNSHLQWYRDYNEVKHNRQDKFEKATFENVILAICSLVSIYFRLFGQGFFNPFAGIQGYKSQSSPFDHVKLIPDTFYVIKYPKEIEN